MLPSFALARPRTLPDALAAVAGHDGEAEPYCGGTELLLAMRAGLLFPEVLVDLKAVPDLSGISAGDGRLLIGATVTHAELIKHPIVAAHAPFLAQVERQVGNPRVRAQGSVGGNLCFGEPKSDLLTALIALRASVVLQGIAGQRELPVADFFEGPYATAKEDGELLVRIAVPLPLPPVAVYLKYQITERPTVAVAAVGTPGAARVVVGAAGELPVIWDGDPAEADPAGLAASVDPVGDICGTEEYKRAMAEVYVHRALAGYLVEEARR
jgi:carbon-monoxide dehydrogenase medium subunit